MLYINQKMICSLGLPDSRRAYTPSHCVRQHGWVTEVYPAFHWTSSANRCGLLLGANNSNSVIVVRTTLAVIFYHLCFPRTRPLLEGVDHRAIHLRVLGRHVPFSDHHGKVVDLLPNRDMLKYSTKLEVWNIRKHCTLCAATIPHDD